MWRARVEHFALQAGTEARWPPPRGAEKAAATAKRLDWEDFWGDFLAVVDTRLSESAEQAHVRVVEAIATARLAFDARFSSMPPDSRDAVLTSIEESYDPSSYEEDLIQCPACGRDALMEGTFDVDWEADYDGRRRGLLRGRLSSRDVLPHRLECRACGLSLKGEEELEAAELPTSWQRENVDAADFYEPDYDWDDYRE